MEMETYPQIAPAPVLPTKPTYRRFVLWFGLILILLLLGAGLWFWFVKSAPERLVREQIQEQQVENTKLIDFQCRSLSDSDQNECIFLLAYNQDNPALCQSLASLVDAISCADAVHLKLALAYNDIEQCAEISDQDRQNACQNTFSPMDFDWEAICVNNPLLCADHALWLEAAEQNNPGLCQNIANPDNLSICAGQFIGQDKDQDDLDDFDELMIYNTNPLNPDTDGDGFSDGQEVDGGYNPNGEGRL